MEDERVNRISNRLVKMTDDKIDEIYIMVKEVHQRQNEVVIPSINKLTSDIEGNGKAGLKTRVTKLETIVMVCAGLITIGSGYLAFIKH